MGIMRVRQRLMTDREKRARLEVENGTMQATQAKALRAELNVSMSRNVRLAKEAIMREKKQKQYEDEAAK